ncbi:MAG: hypothetical protein COY38_00490 [Candidatus Aenigmarchaeota archaeon CG_4_10_14_0_8_um_filter_37_24]|nr:hypothetical protein [Candidatus Aenigmarchaeota archaeon]OIN85446.1 MAG: hypothetical protein AUJ50_05155 [Candidatus Aenigmarchaeota archaeon CG1_02_38_14]PIV68370.1 MAG: hypothetical protein COS07_04230 [Candidatus Aenigmarchaeota archaeon CG01_land_8_20_14_3_00_37_9]PIW40929.1 MAG: hypothetical protein COW21_04650 [Candidatus Aenigmarchaeota archaeon CG15_BIG_FIL_POST_REV_8_21_14_020_37_27]PIX50299.1 MAG: hypothetical protein COZ52_04725 [Candidatus Aenigmarchaeota archaeon CG_4_8_14_3_u
MKYPICKLCLKNEILCGSCAKRVGESLIKIDEIEMFRKLEKLTRKYALLKDVEIQRIIDSPNMLLILAGKENASKIIGKEGGMIKKLSQDLGKQIRVIAGMSNLEDFVKEIFFSTNILGINVIYGERDMYKIRLPSAEREILPIDPDKFSKAANSIFGVDAELVFE